MIRILTILSIVCGIFLIMAFFLTFRRSWTLNLMIWGGFSALIFSPIISVGSGIIAKKVTQDGWAAIGFNLVFFVVLEIISVLLLLGGCIGYFIKKKTPKTAISETADNH